MPLLLLIFLLTPSLSFAASASPSSCTILSSPVALRPGTISPNVLYLQKLLNLDPTTQIAPSGPGSPGKETTRYGPLTQKAVTRFQEKYRADILTPAHLTKGTGFTGPATRKKLLSLYCTSSPPAVATTTSATPPTATSTPMAPPPLPVIPPVVVVPPSSSTPTASYVTIRDGHLFKDEKRLKQWGVNLQSGTYYSYQEVDNLIPRFKRYGFNAVRIWPTSGTFYPTLNIDSFAHSSKGDNSSMDRFDYLISKLSDAGMTVDMTALLYLDLPTIRNISDPEIKTLLASATSDSQLRKVLSIIPYYSFAYRSILKRHMTNFLQHTNPYTGRTYAHEPAVSVWELANESQAIECLIVATCYNGLPGAVKDLISGQWRLSSFNTAGTALPTDITTLLSTASTYAPYNKFVIQSFVDGSKELESYARAQAGGDPGINLQPFIYSTGPIAPSASAHYAYSQGDVFSIGAYSSPLDATQTFEGSAWYPTVAGGTKSPSYLAYVKIANKPMLIYETSFFRPYTFRAEWGPMMAAFGLTQDWDGVFLYAYGQPAAIYKDNGADSGYGTMQLPEPYGTTGYWSDYTNGFHAGGDPVVMASWAAAGQLFLAGTDTLKVKYLWQMPKKTVYEKYNYNGYPAPYISIATEAQSKQDASAIEFVDADISSCWPCMYGPSGRLTSIEWGTERLTIQNSAGALSAGVFHTGETLPTFAGTSVTVDRGGFGVLAVLRNVLQKTATYVIAGKVTNTGFSFNPSAVNYTSPTGAILGVAVQGTAPLIYDGPKMRITDTSTLEARLENFGFTLLSTTSDKTIHVEPRNGIFWAQRK